MPGFQVFEASLGACSFPGPADGPSNPHLVTMKDGFPHGVGQNDHCRLRLRVASAQTPDSDALRIDAILSRNRSADFLLRRDEVDVTYLQYEQFSLVRHGSNWATQRHPRDAIFHGFCAAFGHLEQ